MNKRWVGSAFISNCLLALLVLWWKGHLSRIQIYNLRTFHFIAQTTAGRMIHFKAVDQIRPGCFYPLWFVGRFEIRDWIWDRKRVRSAASAVA